MVVCGRLPGCKGFFGRFVTCGRVQSCVRPVCAACGLPRAGMEYADRVQIGAACSSALRPCLVFPIPSHRPFALTRPFDPPASPTAAGVGRPLRRRRRPTIHEFFRRAERQGRKEKQKTKRGWSAFADHDGERKKRRPFSSDGSVKARPASPYPSSIGRSRPCVLAVSMAMS